MHDNQQMDAYFYLVQCRSGVEVVDRMYREGGCIYRNVLPSLSPLRKSVTSGWEHYSRFEVGISSTFASWPSCEGGGLQNAGSGHRRTHLPLVLPLVPPGSMEPSSPVKRLSRQGFQKWLRWTFCSGVGAVPLLGGSSGEVDDFDWWAHGS